ncbi:MAG: response regulator [Thermodesulfobacteriota bacterium]
MADQVVKVLLVEDDEDDKVLIQHVLGKVKSSEFRMEWVSTYPEALEHLCGNEHDVCLLDYLLGARSGVELLQEARDRGTQTPVIFLTGKGDREVDFEAMKAGAVEYLEKVNLNSALLERTIRYAMENSRAARELRELSRKLLAVQEEERKHLARELHDTLGSGLVAVKFVLESELENARKDRDDSRVNRLEALVENLQASINEARRIQKDLRPPVLDDLGIQVAIQSLCREFQALHPSIEITHAVQIREEDVPEDLKITLYRITQQALKNMAVHSGAASALVRLNKSDDRIELVIQDEGRGFDLEEYQRNRSERQGLGILGMKERAKMSGGVLTMASSKGKGTTIRAAWPYKPQPRPSDTSLLVG